MEILEYFLAFLLGYWVATFIISLRLTLLIQKFVTENKTNQNVKPVYKVPILNTNSVNDTILLYDERNNFICQGLTLEELADNLAKYKQIKIAIINHNRNLFWATEGKIKKINES